MSETAELKLYGPLHVSLIDGTVEQLEQERDCPVISLEGVGRNHIAAYTEHVLAAIQKLQPQEEARSAFSQYAEWFEEVSGKIISIRHTVEQVQGRLYGVLICKSREPLLPEEIQDLKYECRDQFDSNWCSGFAKCPRSEPLADLYIHFWQESSDRLLTKSEFDAALESGQITNRQAVTEVTKDTFWTLIGETKRLCGQDLDTSALWLESQLLIMGPEQARRFDDIVHAYTELSHKYGLWTAASIMRERSCSDDGFADFQSWLIAQGKDIYLAALKDPDSLADVPAYDDCSFPSLSYIGGTAYEKLTGRSSYDDFDRKAFQALVGELKKDIEYGEGIGYPYTRKDVPAYLPRLCRKHYSEEAIRDRKIDVGFWNRSSPDIQAAAKNEKKSRRVKKSRGDSR